MSVTELTYGRRMLVLAICCMSLLIVGLDSTIVNVALPAIHRSLHASLSGLQWTVDAYTLVLASLLMLAGSTADRVGRRRTFQTGLVVFSLASLLCALAPTLGFLVAARVLQAMNGYDNSYVRFVLAQSRAHRDAILKLPLAPEVAERFARLAEQSLAEQRRIEASDTVPFETYRQRYLSAPNLNV